MAVPIVGTGVITRPAIAALESLGSALAATPPYATFAMHLYAAPVAPSIDTVLGQLTECTFDGYADVPAVTMGPPQLDLAGDTVVTPTVVPQFGCTGTVTTNVVYGWYATGPGTLASLVALGTLAPFSPANGVSFTVKPQIGLLGNVNSCLC